MIGCHSRWACANGPPGGVDFDELNLLERLALHVEGDVRGRRFLFSRSGFTDRLIAAAAGNPALTLVTPADIYR
ncbi:MAG: hypothetical protein H0V92_11255 [Pseudonocardiales bacterium]|nr:hypothetical protein [Pseudonocardiales bacterium]